MIPEFRVWDKVDKVYDFPIQIDIDDSGHISCVDTYHGSLVDGDFVLEQYTGLKDVNGNKIFEDDIVESIDEGWSTGGLITGTVQYLTPQFTFDSAGVGRPGIWKVLDDRCRVIGNIHENPELLEVEDED